MTQLPEMAAPERLAITVRRAAGAGSRRGPDDPVFFTWGKN
jgi:hypothetical protein